MAQLQKIIKVTQEQYNTLKDGGTVGDYAGIDPSFIYLVEDTGSASGGGLIKVTYEELVTLRDNEELIPGCYYEIIDYETLAGSSADWLPEISDGVKYIIARTANHYFDLIVLALTNDTLSETAWACHSPRDTAGYFTRSNLAAWEIKYKLDNDSKYFWIYSGCKGVIYYMKDEFGNEAPYDFKNILMEYRYDDMEYDVVTRYTFGATVEGGYNGYGEYESNGEAVYRDLSLNRNYGVYNNKIEPRFIEGKYRLPGVMILGEGCHDNTFSTNCCLVELSTNCSYNNITESGSVTIEEDSEYNTVINSKAIHLAYESINNIIKHSSIITLNGMNENNVVECCNSIVTDIADSCNKFYGCANLSIDASCVDNLFINTSDVSLGSSCSTNTFNNCEDIRLTVTGSNRNTFNNCWYITGGYNGQGFTGTFGSLPFTMSDCTFNCASYIYLWRDANEITASDFCAKTMNNITITADVKGYSTANPKVLNVPKNYTYSNSSLVYTPITFSLSGAREIFVD